MKNIFFIIIISIILIQFIQVDKINPTTNIKYEIKAPENIISVFKRSCYDCHSNNTTWTWYSNIAPLSWTIAKHVKDGRQSLNFSIWNTYTKKQQDYKIKEIFRSVYAAMPPSSYVYFHKKAFLSSKDKKLIRDWTGVMSGTKPIFEVINE
jgi:hypothetical protein